MKKINKITEKIDMYDMILANLYSGNAIIEPTKALNNDQIEFGFSNISSEYELSKYFMITTLPEYVSRELFDEIRNTIIQAGIKVNFYVYCKPYKINWDSAEMTNRMDIWRKYVNEQESKEINAFNFRKQVGKSMNKDKIIKSTFYLNEAELIHDRALIRMCIVIKLVAKRDEESLLNLQNSIIKLKRLNRQKIKVKELRINMIDWYRALSPFSLKTSKEIGKRMCYHIVTDDIFANLCSYKQGKVGEKGIPLGMDIENGSTVFHKFKEIADDAENWLLCGGTGSGKSHWLKVRIPYWLASNYVVVVMDFEGDEYSNLAKYIKAYKEEDVKIISMGKNYNEYFDPCIIADLTGDEDIDCDAMKNSITFIEAEFRIMICGGTDDFNNTQKKIISTAISRMYSNSGVTEDRSTWHRAKELKLRLKYVYDEIKNMVNSKEFIDGSIENNKHNEAVKMLECTSIYFEKGEANYGIFEHPVSADELYKAKMIVFSFGMKGVEESAIDKNILALKQLSVSYVNTQISNYCKYVLHCFNVKIWEEYQRWILLKGSGKIIVNNITGGRKRGDINFITTNDLANILNENNSVNVTLMQNIQNYAIGSIPDKKVREDFCNKFDFKECKNALDNIARANKRSRSKAVASNVRQKYNKSFCIIKNDGSRAVVKDMIPKAILNSSLYRSGVETRGN